jgi:predicted enzyme related to lactoylglutathione lyase
VWLEIWISLEIEKDDQKNDKMNKLIIISVATILISCNSTNKKTNKMEEQKNETTKTVSTNDTTPKVTGIGGIFFFSDNPKETREWYHKNLGLETNDYGSTFESRNVNRPDEINTLQWSLFKKGSEYFAPSKKEFMINYRVQNIEGLVNKLKESGVTIVDKIETYEYGKFVHIMDPEGNKIELWEPVDSIGSQ